MQITSPVFKNGETIPKEYTCEGKNINPPLEFSQIPPGTQSLVLIVEDPDAPDKPWIHWLLFNIYPSTTKIDKESVPENAIEGLASGGTHGYEGPCPPTGVHHYFFKLFALNIMLDLPPNMDKEVVEKLMQGHILDRAELVGVYEKQT